MKKTTIPIILGLAILASCSSMGKRRFAGPKPEAAKGDGFSDDVFLRDSDGGGDPGAQMDEMDADLVNFGGGSDMGSAPQASSNHKMPKSMKGGSALKYVLKEGDQRFWLKVESGSLQDGRKLASKSQMFNQNSEEVERSVVISQRGSLRVEQGQVPILRPFESEFLTWIDGEKFSTRLKLDAKEKKMAVQLRGPKDADNKDFEVNLPANKGVFCFFNQLVECLKQVEFIQRSIAKADENFVASMPLTIIWDNYPYFQQQYSDLPQEVWSDAEIEFVGLNRKKEYNFDLNISGQSLSLFFDKKAGLIKRIWIGQGSALFKI